MKIIVGIFIDSSQIDFETFFNDFKTYIFKVDKAIVYDFNDQINVPIKDRLINNFSIPSGIPIEYILIEDLGEAKNYHIIMEKAHLEGFDYALIMKSGYYFEEGSFEELIDYVHKDQTNQLSVITPFPLYTSMKMEKKEPRFREIKGAHLIGTLINVAIYHKIGPFKFKYYQGYVDYEYCLKSRLMGYKIILGEHLYIWNRNFNIIERTILLQKFSTYEKSRKDLYYDTRNRMALWEEYKGKDDDFIKADKKSFKAEIREMKLIDSDYEFKKEIIRQAKKDFRHQLFDKSPLFE